MISGWVNSIGKPVKNKRLIREVVDLIEQHKNRRKLSVSWTKGHSGNPYNEKADMLAGEARLKIKNKMLDNKTV